MRSPLRWRRNLTVKLITDQHDGLLGVSILHRGFEIVGAAISPGESDFTFYASIGMGGFTRGEWHRNMAAMEMAEAEADALLRRIGRGA